MADDLLRVKIWVDGELVVEGTLTDFNVDGLAREHIEVCVAADRAGKLWLVDVFDPEASPDAAHLRFGTDRDGMVDPQFLSSS